MWHTKINFHSYHFCNFFSFGSNLRYLFLSFTNFPFGYLFKKMSNKLRSKVSGVCVCVCVYGLATWLGSINHLFQREINRSMIISRLHKYWLGPICFWSFCTSSIPILETEKDYQKPTFHTPRRGGTQWNRRGTHKFLESFCCQVIRDGGKKKIKSNFFFFSRHPFFEHCHREREKDRGSLKFVFVDPISEETKVRVLLLGAGEILLDEEGTKKPSYRIRHTTRCAVQGNTCTISISPPFPSSQRHKRQTRPSAWRNTLVSFITNVARNESFVRKATETADSRKLGLKVQIDFDKKRGYSNGLFRLQSNCHLCLSKISICCDKWETTF